MPAADKFILAIESSCDDTAAAVIKNETILSNVIANQKIHELYGGVVPELASRAHQSNIIPVVDRALKLANTTLPNIDAIAFTYGPGLLGSLLVGSSFAKALAFSLQKPLIAVDHMTAHVLALFIQKENQQKDVPNFPFLCLTVSGGHTQIVLVKNYLDMEVIGKTMDDAAGEALDKIAKMLGLPYPGGPFIDKLAKEGDPLKFLFSRAEMKNLDFSFSGIKTAVLYFLEDKKKEDPNFIENNLKDICASVQHTIVEMLLQKIHKASKEHAIKEIGIAGGVSANSYLRKRIQEYAQKYYWKVYIPDHEFCTDNAAMIAYVAYQKYITGKFADFTIVPDPRAGL